MIRGLDHFTGHFAAYADDFVVIGGVAAHEIMGTAGLEFRATKDIDLVIIARPAVAFCQKLLTYIEAGQYEVRQLKDGIPAYYRFLKPKQSGYPAQIEVFSRRPDELTLRANQHIIPITEIPSGADLSAILLEDDYFDLVKSTIQRINGLPVASAEAIIALKGRAYNDLNERKAAGDTSVSSDEIKKHRNDILRLSQALSKETRFKLSGLPAGHMIRFLDEMGELESRELKQLFMQFGITDTPAIWLGDMRSRFLTNT